MLFPSIQSLSIDRKRKGSLAKAGDTSKKQCLLEHPMVTLPLELSAYLSGFRVSRKDLLPSEYFLALPLVPGFLPLALYSSSMGFCFVLFFLKTKQKKPIDQGDGSLSSGWTVHLSINHF